jgi:DNA repair protein RecN (Recombination protein N)
VPIIEQQLSDLKEKLREYERTKDYLNFQITEIETINPLNDEDAELINERTVAINHGKIRSLEQTIYQGIYESDDSITSRLISIRRSLSELAAFDNRVANILEPFDSAVATLTDIAETFRSADNPKTSPGRLDEIEERLAQLEKLKRKYGITLSDVLSAKNEMITQLNDLQTSEDLISTLQTRLVHYEKSYWEQAHLLSEKRSKGADILSKDVTSRLSEVALSDAIFHVAVSSVISDNRDIVTDSSNKNGWSKRGIDTVEFFFTANQGEDLRLLSEVASGGELSRLTLTLHNALYDCLSRETQTPPTLVFDEIDSGISGRVAQSVGRKLSELAKSMQIICITHQPQIARFAKNHFKISKHTHDGRTKTKVNKIQDEERAAELASLIMSDEAGIPVAHQTAEWLLNSTSQSEKVSDRLKGVGSDKNNNGKSRKTQSKSSSAKG